jgi:hypothetical protein
MCGRQQNMPGGMRGPSLPSISHSQAAAGACTRTPTLARAHAHTTAHADTHTNLRRDRRIVQSCVPAAVASCIHNWTATSTAQALESNWRAFAAWYMRTAGPISSPSHPQRRHGYGQGSTTMARAADEQGANCLNDVVRRRTSPICLRCVVKRRPEVVVAHVHVSAMLLDQSINSQPLPCARNLRTVGR